MEFHADHNEMLLDDSDTNIDSDHNERLPDDTDINADCNPPVEILQEIIDHIIPPLEVNKRSQYLSTTSTFLKYRYNYYVTMQSDDCSSHYLNYILGRKSDYYNDRNTSICTKHGVTVGTTSGQIKVSSTHRGIEYACEKTWQEWFALMIIDIALTGDGTDRRAM